MQNTANLCALYMRLSKEDKARNKNLDKDNSDSIESQCMLLEQYAAKNSLTIVDRYKDDGYTGTNFARPDFMRMMEDIKAGKINTVIVKDLSRLGRDYIQSGRYQEMIFPEMGIRLIALGDNYDSDDEDGNDIAPFKNLFNDFYPRDISKKTRNALKARARAGEYLGSCPYGYSKDPNDKHKLIPNEETAPIVKRIFNLVISGYGVSKIARIFSNEGIPTPAAAKGFAPRKDYHLKTDWYRTTVRSIVNNPVYLGNLVQGRTKKLNYKLDKIVSVPEESWITVKHTHEPLISQETWDLSHEIISHRSKPDKGGEPHIFAGLLKCADCGATLAKESGRYEAFCCQRYKVYGKEHCSNHRITVNNLSAVVLASIQEVSEQVQNNRDSFIKQLSGVGMKKQQSACNVAKKELKKLGIRLSEIGPLIKRAFEKNAAGTLPDDVYNSLMADYTAEKANLTERIKALSGHIEEMERETGNVDNFVKLVDKYINIKELDRDILHELIEKVAVHQGYKEHGIRYQQVDIYYRFVGNIDLSI